MFFNESNSDFVINEEPSLSDTIAAKTLVFNIKIKLSENIKVLTDDYSMQNVLKIMNIPYDSIITEGIKGIYNWKKVCEGCKKEYSDDYPFDDCEICGSKIFKKRIKN